MELERRLVGANPRHAGALFLFPNGIWDQYLSWVHGGQYKRHVQPQMDEGGQFGKIPGRYMFLSIPSFHARRSLVESSKPHWMRKKQKHVSHCRGAIIATVKLVRTPVGHDAPWSYARPTRLCHEGFRFKLSISLGFCLSVHVCVCVCVFAWGTHQSRRLSSGFPFETTSKGPWLECKAINHVHLVNGFWAHWVWPVPCLSSLQLVLARSQVKAHGF